MRLFKAERVGFIVLGAGLVFFLSALIVRNCARSVPESPVAPPALTDSIGADSAATIHTDTITTKTKPKSQKNTKKKSKKSTKSSAKPYSRNHRDEPVN